MDVVVNVRRWLQGVLFACLVCAVSPAQAQADSNSAQLARGAELYAQNCANCHYDGAGNPAAPDLKSSTYYAAGPQKVITLLLKGQGGVSVVDGRKLNGQMPKMDYLTDQEIADITAYVQTTFGNKPGAVEPAAVAELRK